MAKKFEYTTLAYRYTARFPLLTYVGTQTNFWIFANCLLAVILNLHSLIIGPSYGLQPGKFGPVLLIAVITGALYGVILGLAGYYLDRRVFRKLAMGKVILLKALGTFALLVLILLFQRYVLFEALISPTLSKSGIAWSEDSWRYLFYLLLVYYSFITLLISFINQVNKKYGPGILVPLLLGWYRDPKEEERIFMFMDLKSSTTTAEELGHLKYSAFIRDCFSDINEALYPYSAQVYQYVGDEIVVTWPEAEGLSDHRCIKFYFSCRDQFRDRSEYYMTNYGSLPKFKAGVHTGIVTTVEIGEYKRDIAYHGDTLNTAARIQSVCNDYGKSLLISKILFDKVGLYPGMKAQELGMIQLKGKVAGVELVSVEWAEAT